MAGLQWAVVGTISGLQNNQQGNIIAQNLSTMVQGGTAPTTSSTGFSSTAGVWWHDTTNALLKVRNQADTAWITVGALDEANGYFYPFSGEAALPELTGSADSNQALTVNAAGTGFQLAGPLESIVNKVPDTQFLAASRYGTSSVTIGSEKWPLDTWEISEVVSASGMTAQLVSDAPVGSFNSLKFTVGTGAAVGSGDFCAVRTIVDPADTWDLLWGTSGALGIYLSFWVKTSLAGTYGVALNNNGIALPGGTIRNWLGSFTISGGQINTWVKQTFLIPGDTGGAGWWGTQGSNIGLDIGITLSAGAASQGTTGWQNGSGSTRFWAPGPVANLTSVSSATFQLAQLYAVKSPVAVALPGTAVSTALARAGRMYRYGNFVLGGQSANSSAIAGQIDLASILGAFTPTGTPTINISYTAGPTNIGSVTWALAADRKSLLWSGTTSSVSAWSMSGTYEIITRV